MRTFALKQRQSQNPVSYSVARPTMAKLGPDYREHPFLNLQRTMGNQAVLRMLQAHAEEPDVGLTVPTSLRFGHNLSRIPLQPPATRAIRTKLAINQPGDKYEQEADLISEQVMRMPEPRLQRSCDCGGECSGCQAEEPSQAYEQFQVQRIPASNEGQTAAPSIVHEVLRSPGQPLDPAVRAFMEPRFGRDFSHVRIHTDAKAMASASAVNALAYTVGRDVVFAAGQYAPQTTEGRRLLAHELAHTLQQSGTARLQRAVAVTKEASPFNATFGFLLEASDLTIRCRQLLWEQWISGGLTYEFHDGTHAYYPACDWVENKEKSRKAGPWCEDLKGLQEQGPRPIKPEHHAHCGGEPNAVLYTFDDAPGKRQNVGGEVAGKKIEGINFDIGITHKLWDARYNSMFFEKVFYLRGRRAWGLDTTRIDL